jgi:hypothetical protein
LDKSNRQAISSEEFGTLLVRKHIYHEISNQPKNQNYRPRNNQSFKKNEKSPTNKNQENYPVRDQKVPKPNF